MAIATAVTVNTAPGIFYPGDTVNCLLTVTNNGGAAVNVTHIEVVAGNLSAGHTVSRPKFAQAQTATVAPSGGTTGLIFSIVPQSPLSNDGGPGAAPTQTNTISTVTYTDDGQAVADTSGATFTVTAPVYPAGGGG